ncbi:MAG: SDR family NAD(P)-dependent oxidoreductase, partial [bacterium]|nr:SDR family NAD(P)-dependent oxidoreductase [bacterium]
LEAVSGVKLGPPQIPFISNLTGTWIRADEAADPTYWVRHLRHTVRFAAGIGELLAERGRILLEVGPGRALATLARQDRPDAAGRIVVHSLRHPQEADHDAAFLLTTLGRLWLAGVEIDWPAVHGGKRRRLVLPTYPFERRRCWIEPQVSRAQGAPLERRAEAAEWLHLPSWQRAPAAPEDAAGPGRWLVFAGSRALGGIAAARLAEGGRRVAVVSAGDAFAERGGGYWTIRPAVPDDYHRLLEALAAQDALPERVLHLWSLDPGGDPRDRGFYSLLFLVQALAGRGMTDPMAMAVATTGAWEVVGGEALDPERTIVLGPCRVIPQEYPHLSCRAVDLPPPAGDADEAWLAEQLIAELAGPRGEPVVAYRGRFRWTQHFVPHPASTRGDGLRPRDGGVYLITGGLGRVGLVLAEALARGAREVKLVLTGRREIPARKIRGLGELEALGAEVLPRAVDVADREAMARLLTEVHERFGALHGVIHAAALTGAGALVPVGTADREACEVQFLPKITGARVLAELLDGAELDYCMLISSLSTVLGGLGFAAYSAANHFLDAFAQARSRSSRFPWVSVGWEAWRFDAEDAAPATALGAAVRGLAVRPDEGRAAMEHLLTGEALPQVLISTVDLAERAAHWAAAAEAAQEKIEAEGELPAPGPAGDRRDLQVAYVGPRNGLERQLAGVWSKLLGIAEIGIHDNFFELGGHSVLATQVVARLRRELRREVPLATFFAHPTVAGLAAELAEDGTAVPGEQELSIPRRPRSGEVNEFPLSFAQQRFWFLDQLEPGNPAYHVPFVFRLGGSLRTGILGRALDALVRRHETLRTTFPATGGEPVQAVGPPRRQELPVIDLGALVDPSRECEMRRLATARVRSPFDLEHEPQLRTTLIRLSPADHVLVLSMHHIASDFWSMGVLTQELTRYYQAFSQGEEANLPELPVQYADFAFWQREWFAGRVLEEQLAYWRQTLAGAPAALELPADHPRPRRPSYRNASRTMRLPAAETAALRELGQRRRATLFMVLIAAFGALLHRLSGQADILLGTPAANRTRTELEGLIGLFINTLVLRVDLGGDPGLLELIERVRRTVLGAQAHQDLPFEQLVDELQPERHLARAPIFQVLFALQTAPVQAVRMPKLSFRPIATEAQAS